MSNEDLGTITLVSIMVIVAIIALAFIYNAFASPESSSSSSSITPTYIYSKVVRVIDGDTIVMETGDKIRLSIVNTPERGEIGYMEAKDFTSALCLNRYAIVDIDDGQRSGSYDRLIGAVYCLTPSDNNTPYFLNLALVTAGHAVVVDKYCERSEFREEIPQCL